MKMERIHSRTGMKPGPESGYAVAWFKSEDIFSGVKLYKRR
jgi:hypothetical protein